MGLGVKATKASVGVVVVTGLLISGAAGQDPPARQQGAPSKAGPAPRTAWGTPDLQGIWTDEYAVPFERPARFANREFLTPEEIAELDKARAAYPTFSVRSQPVGSEQDVAGAYGDDYQSIRRTGRRTSMIVDPPDGRLPPLTRKRRRGIVKPTNFGRPCCKRRPCAKAEQRRSRTAPGSSSPGQPHRAVVRRRRDYLYYSCQSLRRARGPRPRRALPRGGPAKFQRLPADHAIARCLVDLLRHRPGPGPQPCDPHHERAAYSAPAIRQWWGDSRGRWEGDTLVVDVTNFNAKRNYQSSRENLHMVERWTRIGCQYARVRGHARGSDHVDETVDVQGRAAEAERPGESGLLRAPVSRGQFRDAHDAAGRAPG